MQKKTTMLRELLKRDKILMVPGAYDAVSAMAAAKSGFEAVYMTGNGAVTSLTGLPDISLATGTEMVMKAAYMADAISVPLIADADTGYGNAVNVMRTVHQFELAGVAAIHLEDQVVPKRCGHMPGKQVIPQDEMVGKIRAAIEARTDPDFMIIARVDSRAVNGFDDAIRRGKAYQGAGADVIFLEALETKQEFEECAKAIDAPLLANMAEFGKSPYLSAQELEQMGYNIVIFPTTSFKVALKAVLDFYSELKQTGTQAGYLDRMLTRKQLYSLIDYDRFTEYKEKFGG